MVTFIIAYYEAVVNMPENFFQKGGDLMPFNNTLVFLRNQHGMTQEELARKIGVSQAVISMYENGVKIPTIFIGVKIAHVLGVTVEEMVEGNVIA